CFAAARKGARLRIHVSSVASIRTLMPADGPPAAALLEAAGFRGWTTVVLTAGETHQRLIRVVGPTGCPFGVIIAQSVVDEGELLAVVVADTHRRKGHGRRLVQTVLERMVERGVRHLFLEVRLGNRAAQRMYAQLGFEVSGRRAGFYGDEDALIMTAAIGDQAQG
ncbi:MAG: GNAT family N-acetyltransferase, partial [Myxococcota bacterium]